MSDASPPPAGPVLVGYRALTSLYAASVVAQAFLASRGIFNASEQGHLITWHESLANAMYVMIVVQAVLGWILYRRRTIPMALVVTSTILVPLTNLQIHLGYTAEGAAFADTISLHIPLGVLLMGLSSLVATLSWRVFSHPSLVSAQLHRNTLVHRPGCFYA